eukprot:1154208-Pelagomonas_calceolata.AAC.2
MEWFATSCRCCSDLPSYKVCPLPGTTVAEPPPEAEFSDCFNRGAFLGRHHCEGITCLYRYCWQLHGPGTCFGCDEVLLASQPWGEQST